MDPNEALHSILCGHRVFDHVEALTDWLSGGSFEPDELLMPADKHEFFARHCKRQHGNSQGIGVRVKADNIGIWTTVIGDDWYLAGCWDQISMLQDSEY